MVGRDQELSRVVDSGRKWLKVVRGGQECWIVVEDDRSGRE